jgi:hypothetical protein
MAMKVSLRMVESLNSPSGIANWFWICNSFFPHLSRGSDRAAEEIVIRQSSSEGDGGKEC